MLISVADSVTSLASSVSSSSAAAAEAVFLHTASPNSPKWKPSGSVNNSRNKSVETAEYENLTKVSQSFFQIANNNQGTSMGYWHQRANERHGNPPQGNQELLVVGDKVGRPPGELGASKSMECDIFPFSALTLLVGWQEGHPACKKLDVGLLVVMIWLELCTTYIQ